MVSISSEPDSISGASASEAGTPSKTPSGIRLHTEGRQDTDYVRSQIGSTRALDGIQHASWTYHPGTGLDVAMTESK